MTAGQLRPDLAAIAVPATTHGRHMSGDDFSLTAGWGHFGAGQAVMPGQGRAIERAYTGSERSALAAAASVIPAPAGIRPHPPAHEADAGFRVTPSTTESSAAGQRVEGAALDALGATTYDIHLNDHAYWRNVPRQRLGLSAGRLPGPQEVALLPRTQSPRPRPEPRRSPTLQPNLAADRGYPAAGKWE